MGTTEAQAPGGTTFVQRWLARLAFVATGAALLVPPLSAGVRQSLALTLILLAGLIVTVAAVWWALAYKGPVRWLAAAVAVAAPLGLLALYTRYGQVRFGRRWCSTRPCAAPSARPPCASGSPGTALGYQIPSRSWTGSGWGRSP